MIRSFKRIRLVFAITSFVLCFGRFDARPAQSEQDPSYASCLEARRVIERAITAMGGQSAFDAAHDISRTLAGKRIDIGQAMRPRSEYTTESVTIEDVMELKSGRVAFDLASGLLGGGTARSVVIAKDRNNVFSIDPAHESVGGGSITSTGFARHIPARRAMRTDPIVALRYE